MTPFRGFVFLCGLLGILVAPSIDASEPKIESDGLSLPFPNYTLRLKVCAPDIIRVSAAPEPNFFDRPSLIVVHALAATNTPFTTRVNEKTVELTTKLLTAQIDRETGAVTFLDHRGRTILAERAQGRTLSSGEVLGTKVLQIRQQWESPADESLYGLGQTQAGFLNLKGHDLDLWQHNTEVFVPFFVSTQGYGILWDNTSFTRFGDLREFTAIPTDQLYDESNHAGGLSGTYFQDAHFGATVATRVDSTIAFKTARIEGAPPSNIAIHPQLARGDVSARWTGSFDAKETGLYSFQTYGDGGVQLWIDDREIFHHWRQNWLPGNESGQVQLSPGRHRLRLEWVKDQGAHEIRFAWKTPSHETGTSLWSEAADGLDYYFVYGPKLDKVIAGYRRLTGPAPLMPRWAFGLWQSRQRYETSRQSTDVVKTFREKKIPFDVIVQDWFYWPADAWGSHAFDPARFPDPNAWVKELHDKLHAKVMISVWGKFYPGTENFDAMHNAGYLYEPNLREGLKDWLGYHYTFYDALIPPARKLFWSQVDRALFQRGFDAWWLDATEPDVLPTPNLDGERAHLDSPAGGKSFPQMTAYALAQSQAVYEGQRSSAPNQRVFILTRSGFAGQQRYAAATWSGDVTSTWTALRKQLTAGLGFSISGVPYWTMDTGGFSVPARFASKNPRPEDVAEWRELNTRWFQFSTFIPILRVHGEYPYREMWQFGGDNSPAYQTMLTFDRLRYRLLPYIYSIAAQASLESGTLLRPLVMDFTNDKKARAVTDQFLFGPAFMVSPITEYQSRERSVYFPAKSSWYDFWSGEFRSAGSTGQTSKIDAPLAHIPLHVRAGSIIPIGPELQYTSEKAADPITLYVYRGADGDFTLYEDDGVTFDYEKGASSRIAMHWDDSRGVLTLRKRRGEFPGMLKERHFQVVIVSKDHPVPFAFESAASEAIVYNGEAVTVRSQR